MCHVAAAAQLSGWRLACSAMDPSGWWRTAEGRLLLAVVSSPSRQPCCTPHSDGRRLRPPDDERLEVAPRCARHVRGAVELLLGDRALVNLRYVTETSSVVREDNSATCVVRSSAQRESEFARNTLPRHDATLSLVSPPVSPLLFSSSLGLWPSARGDGDSRCESPGRPKGRLPDLFAKWKSRAVEAF